MRKHLEVIANKLRSYKLSFKDDDFEEFLWKYATEVMTFQGIPVRGNQKGYLAYLMNQKAEDMLRTAGQVYLCLDRPVSMGKFHTNQEIREMVRAEHMYGLAKRCN